jgi:hypothetical protein
MSRKRLKGMLKKEMETRISSYSTSPAVNKEDDKPILKGTDNVKNELLGKKKNNLPALDAPNEIKEIPIKKEENKKEVVKDKRYNIFDSDSESDNGSEKGSDSEKDSDSGSGSEEEEINKYKDSESEDSEEDYYKYYKRNSSSREKSVRYEDERKDEKRIKDERENERRKIKDEREEEKRRVKDEREEEKRRVKDERVEEKRRVKDERVEEKRRVKDERKDVRKDERKYENEYERKDDRRRVRDESEDDREDERKSVKDVRKYEDDIDSRNPFEIIPKKAFLQLIKNSNINNISSDCVDEVKEIMNTFLINMFEQFSDEGKPVVAESNDIKAFMSFYLEDEDKELPKELFLPNREVEKGMMEICDKFKVRVRKDVIYLVHLFVECILSKVIKGALMINDLGKAKRLSGKEIRTSYKIYMM